jgi:arylsulfatase A-like enzyme
LGRGTQPTHSFLVWHFPGYEGQQAIRIGDWKGIRRQLLRQPNAPLELYNLQRDLTESQDVAADHPEIVQSMMDLLNRSQTRSDVFAWLGE